LLVVGSGANERQVKARMARLDLSDCVTLTGYLTGDLLEKAFQTSNVFVLPTYWMEGFPVVIGEAMSAGLPIVTTHVRGAADHLEEGINACFVPQRDPAALSETLIRLLANPITLAKMAQANREKIKEFAPLVVAQRYLRVLEEVVERDRLNNAAVN